MIPWQLIDNHAVQIVIGLLLLIWQAWLSKLVISHGEKIIKLELTVNNHYSDLPGRVSAIEDALGIPHPKIHRAKKTS